MFGCLCWGSSDAFGPAFLGLHVWELCFSLVSLSWESCYSLAFWLGNAFGGGGASFALLSLFFSLSSSSSFLPLLPSFLFPLLSSSTAFSSASSFSVFLLYPYLFSSFLPITLPFFFFKLLPSLFFFSSFPLPSFMSSSHSVFLLCPLFFFFF